MCIYSVSDERVGADLGLEVNVGSYCCSYGRQDRWQLEVLIKIHPQWLMTFFVFFSTDNPRSDTSRVSQNKKGMYFQYFSSTDFGVMNHFTCLSRLVTISDP